MSGNRLLTDTKREEIAALIRTAVTLIEEDFPALALTHGQAIDILVAIEKLNKALDMLNMASEDHLSNGSSAAREPAEAGD